MEILPRLSATTSGDLAPFSGNGCGGSCRSSARRCLTFGGAQAPAAALVANDAFVKALVTQMTERYREKWEFDFVIGEPLPASTKSRYRYQLVDSSKLPPLYAYENCSPSPLSTNDDDETAKTSENSENSSPVPHEPNRLADEMSTLHDADSSSIVCPSFGDSWSPTRKLRKPLVLPHATPKKRNIAAAAASTIIRQTAIGDFMPRRNGRRSARSSAKGSPPRRSAVVRYTPYDSRSPRRHSVAN